MNTAIVTTILKTLLAALPKDVVKTLLDDLFDKIEAEVESSPNKYDDALVYPLITTLRVSLDIPDNIGGDED